jgi:murein L,D-transpeptidase YcbB/YkuD
MWFSLLLNEQTRMKSRLVIAALISLMLLSCGGNENPAGEKQVVAEDPEKVSRLVTDFLSDHISKADTSKPILIGHESLISSPFIKEFYSSRQFKPAWTDKGKLNPLGDSMLALVRNAEYYGLIPDDYHLASLDSLVQTAYDEKEKSYNVNKLASADMMLSDAFFTMAVHVSVGRVENDSSSERSWKVHQLDTDLVEFLNQAISSRNFRAALNGIEPQRNEYQSIKRYMNEYRKKFAGVKWDHLPDRKTDSAGFFAGVKKRLVETGDYDSASTDSDSLKMATALKKFQKRYFLEPDGKIGRNTILTLNMTPEDWTRQLAINLERWRWEPEKFEKRHMIVNLPAFKMTVWEADTIVMESRIVCGAVKTQTPELNSNMYQIVLYPYWNVPYSIAWKEILPHVKRDTGYLRRERYEVLDRNNQVVDPKTVNWKRYGKGNLPFKFRQMTGDDNALGIMKFEFNNKWSVYMHDTNAKKYFRFETRAFSHGCMRLEKYMELAHFLIRDDSVKLPKDTFDVWTTLGEQKKINLRKPLPIHVRYFTCDVDTDGNVFVHTDIYLRDLRIMKVLYKDLDGLYDPDKKEPEKPVNADTKKKAVYFRREEESLFAAA